MINYFLTGFQFTKGRYWFLLYGILTLSTVLDSTSRAGAETPSPVSESKTGSKKDVTSIKNDAQWRKKMQGLYKTMIEITTDTSSDRRFNAPENKNRIEKNAKILADQAHDLSKNGASSDPDPSIKIISGLFQNETKRAYSALKSGNRAYAKGILSQVSGFCIACHTRNNSGPSFSSLPLEPMANDLFPIEQGRFYAATRQYERALDLFQKVVSSPTAVIERPLEWEQAVRYGLAISVRVKKDPDQARALVERVIGSKKAPFFLKQDAAKWRESIIKWKEELPRKALTDEGLYSEARQLIAEASQIQKYPKDHAADILYLRATAVIHELLQKSPDGRNAQDALLMAGMSYDVLRPFNLDDIHDIYYQACIKKSPHTSTSEICYRRYEQSTYEGFTGSGGAFLPEDVKQHLQQLENLAHPESSTNGVTAPN
ncbi:MAG: hypothetical protein ABIQ95_09725 [Bdellovibrionia bacterium]